MKGYVFFLLPHYSPTQLNLSIMKKILFSSLLLLTMAVSACKEDNPLDSGGNAGTGTATITLNGGGLTNKTLTFSAVSGAWLEEENVFAGTGLGRDGSDSVQFNVALPSQSTIAFPWSDNKGTCGIALNYPASQRLIGSIEGLGTTTVSSFRAVRQTVNGTFSGKMLRVSATTGENDTLTVTGSFSVFRTF
jgi:hypothetical protein